MRALCDEDGRAFFYMQSAARFTERGTTLDGEEVQAFPAARLGYR